MDIRNCPECGDDTMNAGLAFWPGIETSVAVTRCANDECDWVVIDEQLELTQTVTHAAAA
ncbi:hypothetical protein ELQ92_07475 [Labedella populi]|uniref:Uncharacterized protein n=1 Tax=Labedella populi TaxID=2498850 RepID=A0A3S3ZQQ7_9MICO|nr:hypothetical protein [Labedella populi]RWZ64584.1 hypothetical protein ELQ92_07475 [Labedella populi]